MNESELQKECQKILKDLGIRYLRISNSSFRGHNKSSLKGFSDLFWGYGGQIYSVELKTSSGKLSSEQIGWIKIIKETWGGETAVCRSVDEFIERLRQWGIIKR